MSEVLPADSGVGTLAVFMASSGTTDIANRNSPATPPNTLNLRSSHNELLNAEIKHSDAKNSTPPKCRKKYALTNIQAAMGLSDPAVQPLLGNGSANIKLVKNGENQLRKAAEQGQQDPNKNLSPAAVINLTSEKLEGKDLHPQESSGCEILPSQPRRTKSFLNYYADLETSARELGQNLGPCQGVGEEKAQPGPGQAPVVIGNGDLVPQKPNKPQSSPEDGQVATVSSSPETKKDHPKTGAKTDCALHRIQNLAPSDEESSWTTLSQDSASPSSPDETADIWSDHSFQTDPDLPPGWKRVSDIAGTYYWHIPTGTTQWERPVSIPADLHGSRKGSLSSVTPSPTPENEKQPWSDFAVLNGGKINSDIWKDLHAATVNPDPSLKEFEGATLRYASLKLRNAPHADDDDSCSINSDPEAKGATLLFKRSSEPEALQLGCEEQGLSSPSAAGSDTCVEIMSQRASLLPISIPGTRSEGFQPSCAAAGHWASAHSTTSVHTWVLTQAQEESLVISKKPYWCHFTGTG